MLDFLVPDPFESDRKYERYNHLDLSEMDDGQLQDELHFLRALLLGLPAEHWLRERVKVLEEETSKRSGEPAYKASRYLNPTGIIPL